MVAAPPAVLELVPGAGAASAVLGLVPGAGAASAAPGAGAASPTAVVLAAVLGIGSGVPSAAAVVLAAVLAVAAGGKLLHRRRTEAGFQELGLPVPAVLAWAVPGIEAAVAVGLLIRPGWGGVLAFALLAGFTAYLAALVRSGRQVSCGCFGSSGGDPVSRRDLVRNGLLLVAAAIAATADGALHLEPVPLLLAAALAAAAIAALRRLPARGPASHHASPADR